MIEVAFMSGGVVGMVAGFLFWAVRWSTEKHTPFRGAGE